MQTNSVITVRTLTNDNGQTGGFKMNKWYRVLRMMLYSIPSGKAIPIQAWTGPFGFQEVGAPRISLDNRHTNVAIYSG
jgi:hypothetical protein